MSSLSVFNEFDTRMNRLMNRWVNDVFDTDWIKQSAYPRLDMISYNDKIVVEAAVPGLTEKDVWVEYEKGVMLIKGTSVNSKEETKGTVVHKELHKSTFTRSFTLDERDYDVSNTAVKVENGLLTVTVPRKVEKKREWSLDFQAARSIMITGLRLSFKTVSRSIGPLGTTSVLHAEKEGA